ncbi:MAG: hypothetical protein ABEJ28_00475 [Salinigranum sp.]
MNSLEEAVRAVESRRKVLEVFSGETDTDLVEQFATKNVTVVRRDLPPGSTTAFAVVRDEDGTFLGSIGLDALAALVSPQIHPPWTLTDAGSDYDEVFDFLDNTLFRSFDRRQMLATAREIEERAWRRAEGTLHTGFQNARSLRSQTPVYDRLAARGGLDVRVYVSRE